MNSVGKRTLEYLRGEKDLFGAKGYGEVFSLEDSASSCSNGFGSAGQEGVFQY